MIWFPETTIGDDISDSTYFEVSPWKDFISNSKLSLIDPSKGGSMKIFLKSWKNERRSKALQTGTIVHSLLLQSDSYGISDVLRPTGKLGDMVYDMFRLRNRDIPLTLRESLDLVVKLHNYYGGKSLTSTRLKTAILNGLPYYKHLMLYKERDFILNSEEVEVVLGCLESLKANSEAIEVLFPKDPTVLRFNEFSIYTKVKVNTSEFYLKIKVDNWTLNLKTKEVYLNDLKTTGSNIDNFVNGYYETYPTESEVIKVFHPGSFQKYSYYRQLAMYAKVLEMYVIKHYGFKPKMYINIVAVETRDPYISEVFNFGTLENDKFSSNQLTYGLEELENLLTALNSANYEQNIEWVDSVTPLLI